MAHRLVRRTVGVHAVPVDVDADLVVPRGQERRRVVGDNPLRPVPTYRRLGLCEHHLHTPHLSNSLTTQSLNTPQA